MNVYEQLKKDYEAKRKKYSNLPPMDELNEEFEIEAACYNISIPISFPIRFVRRTIVNLFSFLLNYLHEFIYPNRNSAVLMEEFKSFDEKEKDEIVKIIARVMAVLRLNTSFALYHNEKKEADFIEFCCKEWFDLKEKLKPISEKNISFWKNYEQKTF